MEHKEVSYMLIKQAYDAFERIMKVIKSKRAYECLMDVNDVACLLETLMQIYDTDTRKDG